MDENIMNQSEDINHNNDLTHKVARLGMLIGRLHMANGRAHGRRDPLRGQGRLLTLLKATPQTTQRDLGYVLDMRQQSLSELLAKLEEQGFVTREKSSQDARVTVITLTEAGRAAAEEVSTESLHPDIFDTLTQDEKDELSRLVDKVTESVQTKLIDLGDDPRHRHGLEHPHGHHGPCTHHGPHGHHGVHEHNKPYGHQSMHEDSDTPDFDCSKPHGHGGPHAQFEVERRGGSNPEKGSMHLM